MQAVTTTTTTQAPTTTTTTQAPQAAPAVVQAPVTGAMLRTLAYLATQTGPVTHNAIAAATGRNKGNQLRPLLALGYTTTTLAPGVRGYVYAITPAGATALAAAQAAGVRVPAPAVPQAPVVVVPPVPTSALLAGFGLAPVAAPAPQPAATQAPATQPAASPAKPARKPRKGK